MKQIIFVGSKTNGYFAEEVAKIRGYEYICILPCGNIKEQTNDILFAATNAEYIIFDVEQYISSAEEITNEIASISAATSARPIVYAPAFIPGSTMARSLYNKDIKSFVLSGSATSLKDQLEKNMTGFFDINERKEIEEIKNLQEEEKSIMERFSTIGVVGAGSRIGTTTQAVQIVKYLNLKGYKACYVELNENTYSDSDRTLGIKREVGFVEKIKSWFDIDKVDEELGMINCFGIDMFYKQQNIFEVLKMGYDYYVYDYGVYTDGDFNKTSFIRENIKIFVVGASPTELDATLEIAENLFYEDAKLLFSLVSEEEADDLISLTENIKKGNGKRTYFAGYTPDMFTFTNLSVYEKILPVENILPEEEKVKKGFFRKNK